MTLIFVVLLYLDVEKSQYETPCAFHVPSPTFTLLFFLAHSLFSCHPTLLLPTHRNATSVKEENVLKLRQNSAEKERKVGGVKWVDKSGEKGELWGK